MCAADSGQAGGGSLALGEGSLCRACSQNLGLSAISKTGKESVSHQTFKPWATDEETEATGGITGERWEAKQHVPRPFPDAQHVP